MTPPRSCLSTSKSIFPSVNASGNSVLNRLTFSASRSAERVSASSEVSFFIMFECSQLDTRSALRRPQSLEFQVQLHLSRNLLLLGGSRSHTGHLQVETRALLQRI